MISYTVSIPVSLGGTGTVYRSDTGTNGMASQNGYGYNTNLFPMLGEFIAMGALLADLAQIGAPTATSRINLILVGL